MYVLRDIAPEDLDGLHAVAAHLDTVNLPDDREVLAGLIALSQRSFSGQLEPARRQYVFGLFDVPEGQSAFDGGRLVGTSMIHAQHGTRRAPHIFFHVLTDERYSESLDRHFEHCVLKIGYNYNGPTEIGGLVLLPEYRQRGGLGKLLSYVRFLYIALHRNRFRDEVLSELMPPLEPDGTSLLWECLGRHFTGMSYQEADRISQTNKEFIRALFPSEPLYACLLPWSAQALIGKVGPETLGVEKMLRRIGFQYAARIDPFDGGPHYTAPTDEITLVQHTRRLRVSAPPIAEPIAEPSAVPGTPLPPALVCRERDRAPYFVAMGGRVHVDGDQVRLAPELALGLGLGAGDEVGVLPL